MNDPLILVLDAGTVAARASLVSIRGELRLIEQGALSYEQDVENPLRRQFDPQQQAALLGRLAARVLSRLRPSEHPLVAAVAVTGQRGGMVALDADGATLFAAPQFDARALESGLMPTADDPLSNRARLAWLKANEPGLFKSIASLASIPGFFAACLTGAAQLPEVPVTAAGFGSLSLETARWDARMVEDEGLSLSQLGVVGEATQPCGGLSPGIASALGLPTGLPVVLAGHGTACATLGAGSCREGDVTAVLGSLGRVSRLQGRLKLPADPRARLEPALAAPLLSYEAGLGEVGFLLSWFAEDLAFAPWELLYSEAMATPVGSWSVRAQLGPRVEGASRQSCSLNGRWQLPRGLPYGRRLSRGALFRSLLESVAFALKQGLSVVESPGFPERAPIVRVCGPMARAPGIGELLASVLERRISIAEHAEVTSLGAAMVAATALGLYASLQQASIAMAAPPRIAEPRAEFVRSYLLLYEDWLEACK